MSVEGGGGDGGGWGCLYSEVDMYRVDQMWCGCGEWYRVTVWEPRLVTV